MRNPKSFVRILSFCALVALSGCVSGTATSIGAGGEDAGVGNDVGEGGDDDIGSPADGVGEEIEGDDVFDAGGEDVAETPDGASTEPDVSNLDPDISDPDPDPVDPDVGETPPEEEDDDDYVLPSGTKFVWPLPAWVTSNHKYPSGSEHSGSADLAVPYWTDVGAARGGTVTKSKWGNVGGYYVHIEHESGYKTIYSHLSEMPVVSVGDTVVAGQLIGYAGRTGNALNSGCHLHFSITKNGQRQVVPQLGLGDWVSRGEAIAGSYGGLSDLSETGNRFFDIRVHEDVGIHEEASGSSPVLSRALKDEVLTVTASKSGYYRVRHNGQRGFVAHTATRPMKSHIRSFEITATNANIRNEAGMNGSVVGTIPNGTSVTVFETEGNWQKLLFDLPAAYRWTHTNNTRPTEKFGAKIRSKNANVRSGPGTQHSSIALIPFYTELNVLEVKEGWYRFKHQGQDAWVAGWLTQGQF